MPDAVIQRIGRQEAVSASQARGVAQVLTQFPPRFLSDYRSEVLRRYRAEAIRPLIFMEKDKDMGRSASNAQACRPCLERISELQG